MLVADGANVTADAISITVIPFRTPRIQTNLLTILAIIHTFHWVQLTEYACCITLDIIIEIVIYLGGGTCHPQFSSHKEAYLAAGEIGFGWCLVEHYSSYHVNRPNSCGSEDPTKIGKYPPCFHMGYRPFNHILDGVDPHVESFLPLQQGFLWSSL